MSQPRPSTITPGRIVSDELIIYEVSFVPLISSFGPSPPSVVKLGRQILGERAMERRPWLCPVIPGQTCTGVVAAEQQEDGGTTVCRVVGSLQAVSVRLALTPGSRFTLYFFLVGDGPELLPTPESQVLLAGPVSMGSFLRVKENCAGIGGIGHGCIAGGATVCAAMDVNKFAVHHLKGHYTGEILEGNVNSDHDLLRLHHAGGASPAVETAGFPCQPFSRQGDGLAFLDSRSQAFWGVLRSAYLHQAAGTILECVVEVAHHLPLQQALRDFAQGMGWHLVQTKLDLHLQWPTHAMVGAFAPSTDAAASTPALASGPSLQAAGLSSFEMAFMGTFGCGSFALHGPRARLLHEQNLWE